MKRRQRGRHSSIACSRRMKTTTTIGLAMLGIACGNGVSDSGGAGHVHETCDEIECYGAADEGHAAGYTSRGYWESRTCEWTCIEEDGRMVSVSRTWVRVDDGCFVVEQDVVESCQ